LEKNEEAGLGMEPRSGLRFNKKVVIRTRSHLEKKEKKRK